MSSPQLERATGDAAPVVARLVRFGFATKGVVTFLVGALALRYATGRGGEITGQEGAIRLVLHWPFRTSPAGGARSRPRRIRAVDVRGGDRGSGAEGNRIHRNRGADRILRDRGRLRAAGVRQRSPGNGVEG